MKTHKISGRILGLAHGIVLYRYIPVGMISAPMRSIMRRCEIIDRVIA